MEVLKMEGTNALVTRPELIKRVRSKELIDAAVRTGKLPAIRVGKAGTKRPRYLFRPQDVEVWLESLTQTDGGAA